jgi:hypothetical protein
VAKLHIGFLATPNGAVNINSAPSIPSIVLEVPSSNDFLGGIRIVITYILAEKRGKKKGFFSQNSVRSDMSPTGWRLRG